MQAFVDKLKGINLKDAFNTGVAHAQANPLVVSMSAKRGRETGDATLACRLICHKRRRGTTRFQQAFSAQCALLMR